MNKCMPGVWIVFLTNLVIYLVNGRCPSGYTQDRIKGCIKCADICQPGTDPYNNGQCKRRCPKGIDTQWTSVYFLVGVMFWKVN